MNNPIYQVFIGSTFEDLKNERKTAFDALKRLHHLPMGMEIFPGVGEQLEYINGQLERSDYYLLIMGGKYGSLTDEGISYTEWEFNRSKALKIPIVSMLYEDYEILPPEKRETDPEKLRMFINFRNKIKKLNLVKFWSCESTLSNNILTTIPHAIQQFPRPGFIRRQGKAVIEVANDDEESSINLSEEYIIKAKADIRGVQRFYDIPTTWKQLFLVIGNLVSEQTMFVDILGGVETAFLGIRDEPEDLFPHFIPLQAVLDILKKLEQNDLITEIVDGNIYPSYEISLRGIALLQDLTDS